MLPGRQFRLAAFRAVPNKTHLRVYMGLNLNKREIFTIHKYLVLVFLGVIYTYFLNLVNKSQ